MSRDTKTPKCGASIQMIRTVTPAVIALLALAIPPNGVRASRARFPIFSLPATLTVPGEYYLASDLAYVVPAADAITVNASGVTIDLEGHTLTATSCNSAITCVNHTSDLTVCNGHIVCGDYGIVAQAGGLLRIEGVTFAYVWGSAPHRAMVTLDRDPTGTTYPSVDVTRCVFATSSGSVASGSCLSINKARGGRIAGNDFTGINASSNQLGLYVSYSTGVLVEDNSVSGLYTGIQMSNCAGSIVRKNAVAYGSYGISWLTSSNALTGQNFISHCTVDGYLFSSRVTSVYRNNASLANATNYSAGTSTDGGGNQ